MLMSIKAPTFKFEGILKNVAFDFLLEFWVFKETSEKFKKDFSNNFQVWKMIKLNFETFIIFRISNDEEISTTSSPTSDAVLFFSSL
jgi:hypothetical protein